MNVFVTRLIYCLIWFLRMVYSLSLSMDHIIFFIRVFMGLRLSIKFVSHCTRLILLVHLIECLKHVGLVIQAATDHSVIASIYTIVL
jgi:hypothetical protein